MILDIALEKILEGLRIAKFDPNFTSSDIQLRSTCFIDEMKKRGAVCCSLRSTYGFTNNFKMELGGRTFRFETLPIADFASKFRPRLVEDKQLAKQHCQKGGFPVARGKSFWFWQKKKAMRFARQLGFPLVVKPRTGSVARHVTTNIQNDEQLEKGIRHALKYSPTFIVERFIKDSFVHRATVIDFDYVACVRQVPANVSGDGVSRIRQLIDAKNQGRGRPEQKEYPLNFVVEDEIAERLLSARGYNFDSVPGKGDVVYLQKDPFLRLGGDLDEVTDKIHPDNIKLFKDLARHFDIRVTGIDFLAPDIAVSWKDQPCAILELNSVPCIELHHFPSSGLPENPAKALADMFLKYYL